MAVAGGQANMHVQLAQAGLAVQALGQSHNTFSFHDHCRAAAGLCTRSRWGERVGESRRWELAVWPHRAWNAAALPGWSLPSQP